MNLGIIPARGGSSLTDKNIRELCGKPLIAWVIGAALVSEIDRLIVSTDDPRIGEVAAEYGAEVMIRPPEIARDKSASEDALEYVMGRLGQKGEMIYDNLVFLQCTSPMTKPEDINACIDELGDHDCCFTVQRTSALLWDEGGSLNHDWKSRPMRQDRYQYEETGAVYAMRMGGFLEHRYRFFGKMAMHETERNVDINDIEDFAIAEVLMK